MIMIFFSLIGALLINKCLSATVLGISTVSTIPNQKSNSGSIYGGTVLHVIGKFDDISADSLVMTIGSSACAVSEYHFMLEYLECIVPSISPVSSSTVPISFYSPESEFTYGPNVILSYTYSLSSTAMIFNINPTEATPGETINFEGRWMTTDWTSLQNAMVGQKQGLIIDDGSRVLQVWGPYNVSVVIGDNVNGDSDPSILLTSGFAGFNWLGRTFTPNGDGYWFRVLARIDEISSQISSKAGGLVLSINGQGFPSNVSRISIDTNGVPCLVTGASYTQINCTTQPGTTTFQSVYAGNAGLIREFWNNTFDSINDLLANDIPPTSIFHQATPEIRRNEYNFTSSRMFGLFVPPNTGNYTFFIASDDNATVFFSTDDQPNNMQAIINFQGSTLPKLKMITPGTWSQPIHLQAGNNYYYEIWHYCNDGLCNFDMGVQVPSEVPKANKMPFIQQIQISPATIVREVQIIKIIGKGSLPNGILAFKYGSASSAKLNFDSATGLWDCSSVLPALQVLAKSEVLACVSQIQGTTIIYNITFNSPLTTSRSQITADVSSVRPIGSSTSTTVVPGSTTLGGSFAIMYNGVSSGPILFGSSQVTIEFTANQFITTVRNSLVVSGQTTLEVLNATLMLPSDVVISGKEFQIDISQMTGGGIAGSIHPNSVAWTSQMLSNPNNTDQYFTVIPSDFLRTYETSPQMHLVIDGLASICATNCSFEYVTVPSISSFSTSNGVLSLQGTGFNNIGSSVSDYSVTVGTGICEVTAVSDSQITCNMGVGIAGQHTPVVIGNSIGQVPFSPQFTQTIPQDLEVSSIFPTSAGKGGGITITVTGTGFLDSLSDASQSFSATFGSLPCLILTSTTSFFQCVVPPYISTSELIVNFNSYTTSSNLFQYSNGPLISAINCNAGSPITLTHIVLTGTGFSNIINDVQVHVGSLECLLTSASLTQIDCDLLGGPPGVYNVSVFVQDQGFALFGEGVSNTFELLFTISSISPVSGSMYGGTLITVTGSGFSLTASFMTGFFGTSSFPCAIQSTISENQFTCTSPSVISAVNKQTEFILYGRLTDKANCTGNCWFTWDTALTPTITSIQPTSVSAGDSFTVTGSAFGNDPANIVLMVGGTQALITSASDTYIQATLPVVQGSVLSVSLTITDRGLANSGFNITNLITVTSVSPNVVSQGGEVLSIFGSGFLPTDVFNFGSTSCASAQIFVDHVSCVLGADSSNSAAKGLSVRNFVCQNLAVCGVTQSASLTFPITKTSGNLSISGSFPAVTSSQVIVYLGSFVCAVTQVTSNAISCTPDAPPGSYYVSVHISGYGYSTGLVKASVGLSILSAYSEISSFQGGGLLNFTGTGLNELVSVTVCNNSCSIIAALGNFLNCSLPALVTEYSESNFQIQSTGELLTGLTYFGSQANKVVNAYDGNLSTYYISYTVNVYIGIDAGPNNYIQLSEVQFVGGGTNFVNYLSLIGTEVQGSSDGLNWDTIYTFEVVNNYWNSWVVELNRSPSDNFPVYKYRFYRLFMASAPSGYLINELQWYGILYSNSTVPSTNCPISIKYGSYSATAPIFAQYSAQFTPVLTSISPLNGTTLGGTQVNLAGSGFGPDASLVTVLIDEILCEISNISDQLIECVTGPRPTFTNASLEIFIQGKGFVATQGLVFLYADKWSSSTTWGGETPPRPGESVSIPSGQNIILDMSTGLLDLIYIEGTLVVQDMPGVTIDAYYIFIQGGTLQIGTETRPFTNDITVTLHGNRTSPALPYYGNKFIAVRGGTLDLHGSAKTPSWTVLASTAKIGDTSITLTQTPNWNVGDSIVIASTSYDYTEAEVRIIAGINGNVILLDSALHFSHYANTEIYGYDSIDMRAEVAVLTRNIKIRGSDEGLSTEHGVHIMLYLPGNESCVGRIENTEIFYAGQAYNLGRYPIHFHMIGDITKSYVKNNAIHDTFNRAVTIHGVFYFTVIDNVAYNIKGHTYFIEDGIETQNVIQGNLGISTHPSWSLLNTDQTPATFWITNPNNFVLNNHAAGGSNYGYWYSLPANPTGPSATLAVCPRYSEMGLFENNTAHSYGKHGLWLFVRFMPLASPCVGLNSSNEFLTANFNNFTAWKCGGSGAAAEEVGDIRFNNFKIADSVLSNIEFTYAGWSDWYKTTRITNALIIGNSQNSEGLAQGVRGVVAPQTDGMLIEGVRFFNFNTGQFILGDESHSVICPVFDSGGRLVKFSGLSIDQTAVNAIYWENPRRGIFQITDNQSVFPNGTHITAYWPHLLTQSCTYQDTFKAIICTNETVRRITIYNDNPEYILTDDIKAVRMTGSDIPMTTAIVNGVSTSVPIYSSLWYFRGQNNHRVGPSHCIPMVTKYTYNLFYGNLAPVEFDSIMIEQDILEPEDYFIVHFNLTNNFTGFLITRGELPQGASPANLSLTNVCQYVNRPLVSTDPSCTFTFQNGSVKYLEIIFSGKPLNPTQIGDITITRLLNGSNTLAPVESSTGVNKTVYYWSNFTTWQNTSYPKDGDSVYIPPDWYLILDVNTPILQYLEVNGVLEFDITQNITLNSKSIFVREGSIFIGNATNPVPANISHQIVLFGNSSDVGFYFSPDVEPANKIFVITGNVNVFGYPKSPFSMLEQNAYPGDDFIFVGSVNWVIGDQVTIATSGFDRFEEETFTIIEVVQDTAFVNGFLNDNDWIISNKARSNGKGQFSTNTPQDQTTPGLYQQVTKLRLNSTLQYYHSGASIIIDGQVIDMRCEVILLNRNVKIIGDPNGWAGLIVVSDFLDTQTISGSVMRNGSLICDSVQFDNLGQLNYLYGGLRFVNSANGYSSITNNIFANSGGWCIHFLQAFNLIFDHNVVYNSLHRGLIAEYLMNTTISNNIVMKTYFNRNVGVEIKFGSAAMMTCFSKLCSYNLTNNRVIDSQRIGHIVGGLDCNDPISHFSGNLARSATYAVIIDDTRSSCIVLANFTVLYGMYGVNAMASSSNIVLQNLKLAENQVGISMLLQYNSSLGFGEFTLENSLIVGKTIHSFCQYCWTSDCYNRTGLFIPSSSVLEKHVALTVKMLDPIIYQNQDPNIFGSSSVNNVIFSNFNGNSVCGNRDFAMTSDMFASDYTFPLSLSNINYLNSDSKSLVYFYDPNPAWLNPNQCGFYNCTGLLNILVHDVDGSFMGGSGGYLFPNSAGIASKENCSFSPEMNAFVCPNTQSPEIYELLMFNSLDIDNTTRSFSPINITSSVVSFDTYAGPHFYSQVESFMDHSWGAFYTMHIRESIFPAIIRTGNYYNFTATGTWPNSMQFRLFQTLGLGRPMIITIRYQDPQIVVVYNGPNLISPISYTSEGIGQCSLSDPHGTNRWFYETNTLQFVISSESPIIIKKIATLQLSLEMDMTLNDFFNNTGPQAFIDKLAVLLQIPPYTIRTVSIVQGSVIGNFAIIGPDDPNIVPTSHSTLEYLQNLEQSVTTLISTGHFESFMNVSLMKYSTSVNYIEENFEIDSNSNDNSTWAGPATDLNELSEDLNGEDSELLIVPSKRNDGKQSKIKNSFSEAMDDWVIGLIAGFLLAGLIFSGLFCIKRKNIVKKINAVGESVWGAESIDSTKQIKGKNLFASEIAVPSHSPEVSFNP